VSIDVAVCAKRPSASIRQGFAPSASLVIIAPRFLSPL
jgi:hypothetical protein